MNQPAHARNFSRRSLLKLSTVCIGAGTLTVGWPIAASADPIATARVAPQNALSPDEALTKLMVGNQRFVERKWLHPGQDFARVTAVADGQAPFAAILSCADSRVVPEIAFDQGIGDLFVARVAGNVAITEEIASEEYAIAFLGTPLLMVLGHERCGAVTAALQGGELPGALKSLVDAIQPAVKASAAEPGDRLTNAVKANVRLQVQRLQTSTVIAAAVQAGTLKVVGAYYDLDTGAISLVS
jgi:carbonic anhydrase